MTRPARRAARQWPSRRFVVADRSMEPALVAGQGLVAVRWPVARPGQIRVVEHPDRAGFWLVKRVASVDATAPAATMYLRSDNDAVATIDSGSFGEVPVAGSWLVVVRVPTRWM